MSPLRPSHTTLPQQILAHLSASAALLHQQVKTLSTDDAGMSTVEYAIGTIGAAAFGALLIAVVKSDGVQQSLLDIIQQALTIR